MFNPYAKFEVSMTNCSNDVKNNAKYNKNSSGDEIANVLVNDDIAHT